MVSVKTDGLDGLIHKLKTKMLVCFGAGKHFETIMCLYSSYHLDEYVKYIIDNNPVLYGTYKKYYNTEYEIISLDTFKNRVDVKSTVVLITSHAYSMEIVSQLDKVAGLNGLDVYIGSFLSEISGSIPTYKITTEGQVKIPKIIHYCWFGKGEIPRQYQQYMDSWIRLCPNYKIKRWDESNFDISTNRYMRQAYEQKKWAFVSDYARIKIINENGGIYLDCDVELLKSLDDFLTENMFCGFENKTHINLGLGYGAVRGHPYLERLMEYYENLDFINPDGSLNMVPCTAYQTVVMKEFGLQDDNTFQRLEEITVYPTEVFSPVSSWGKGEISPQTYSVHHFEASWQKKEIMKKINSMYTEYCKRESMDPKISVIVPIYNVKPYLRTCIESLLHQSLTNLEIVLVDDGSTDGCFEICEEYRQTDSRIIVIHKANGGLVSARKAGLKAAHGQYIAYVDGDDWIEPDMYERMYKRLIEQQVDVVMCGRYEDTKNVCKEVFHGIPEGRYEKEELLHMVYPQMIVGHAFFEWCIFPGLWDKLFRRECIEPFQVAVDDRIVMGEDAACVYPCLLNVESIYIMHECLYHYRQTTSSMVKQIQDYKIEREQFRILHQSVNQYFEQNAHIFDLREQWKKYILFLMLPRADGLYKGYEKLDYLFPFPKVKKGYHIILYGSGTYGQRLYRFLKNTSFCNVTAWVDRNYLQFQSMDLPVENPSVICGASYDAIVIANTYELSRKSLYQELIKKYPIEKVHMIDEKLIFSKDTMQALGLWEEWRSKKNDRH